MAVQICVPTDDWGRRLQQSLSFLMPGGLGAIQAFSRDMRAWPSPASMVAEFMSIIDLALRPLKQIAQLLEFVVGVLNCINAIKDFAFSWDPDPILECVDNLVGIINRLAEYIPPIPYMRALGSIVLVMITYLDETVRALLAIDARISQMNAIRARAATLEDPNLDLVANCVAQEIFNAKTATFGGIESLMLIIGSVMGIVRLILDIAGLDALTEDLNTAEAKINEAAAGGVPGLDTIRDIIQAVRPFLCELYRLLTFPVGTFVDPGPTPDMPFVNN